MSDFSILSATGNKSGAGVDDSNHLLVRAVTETENDHHANMGHAYNWNTGAPFDIGANNSSAVAFLKNTDQTYDLVVSLFVYNLGIAAGAATDGSEFANVVVVRNPTSMSAGSSVDPVNKCMGSSSALNGTFTAATVGGGTFTGGSDMIETLVASASGGRIAIDVGSVILPPQTSTGIRYEAHASTTQQYVQFATTMFLDKQ